MKNTELKPWKLDSSKLVIDDRFFKLQANSYTTADGQVIEPYYLIDSKDWANCFVIDDELNVILVEHYRPGARGYVLGLVSGELETNDSSPEDGMRRELREEIGYVGGTVRHIGTSYANPGRQNNKVHSFIAYGGHCSEKPELEKGEDLRPVEMSYSDVMAAVQAQAQVFQSFHLTTIFFAQRFMAASDDPVLRKLVREGV